MPLSLLPEHKIGVFVRFLPSEPSFSGISSTKSGFLCFFGLRNPRFRAFRAQNQGFCALLESGTLVFGHFEHKIGVFVRLLWKHWPLETEKRANFLFLRAFDLLFRGYRCCGCLWQAFSPRRCHRRVAAEALPPERCRLRVISPPRSLRRLLRRRFCRRYGRCRSGRRRCCR